MFIVNFFQKFGMNSFTELFPSIAGAEKLQLEDTLNKKCFPRAPSKRKKVEMQNVLYPKF